ncbi:malonate decarboxylase holo-ACP synthase [Tenebrionicola larvae]|uniref:malonate decarboxylase holo-ACP synthase n=1 Tax=Tenebrionicola larvae TaxID=2815733 RepID=UPI002011E60E|nr:malonate decarboxylase holo-ACP synthase [Tenebrionicola larvae]
MMQTPQPHDLLWLDTREALQGADALWVSAQWRPELPVVVRRDIHAGGMIPVGVRGLRRDQRAAGWASASHVVRRVTPEALADLEHLLHSPFVSQPPVQAAIQLAMREWRWSWGIAGSAGYALATGIPVLHADSDIDLLIRAPQRPDCVQLEQWRHLTMALPCRADTQVETPRGGFALTEWLREGRVLLKTASGPQMTVDPWQQETP